MTAALALTGDEIDAANRRALTARQRAILDFIRQHIQRESMAPTLREIGKAFGIRSTNGVNDHLRALERKGYIRRHEMLSRAIVIAADGGGPADPLASLREENRALRTLLRRVVEGLTATPMLTARMALVVGDIRVVLRGGK